MRQWSLRVGLKHEMACFVDPSETLALALCSNGNSTEWVRLQVWRPGPRASPCQLVGSKGSVFNNPWPV